MIKYSANFISKQSIPPPPYLVLVPNLVLKTFLDLKTFRDWLGKQEEDKIIITTNIKIFVYPPLQNKTLINYISSISTKFQINVFLQLSIYTFIQF